MFISRVLREEYHVKVKNCICVLGSVLSPFSFSIVADDATEFAREGMLSELMNADDCLDERDN